MCGVVGGRGEPSDVALAALEHRGPDAGATWRGKRYWLGHRRLAIIDTSSASEQPFRRGRVVLSYNGELWNYEALRRRLVAQGETFRTTGDTEVVAAMLDVYGPGALLDLEGMFGLAWTDDEGETLRVARDRFGEVPLHAYVGRDRFAVASELKALLALGLPASGYRWVGPGEVWHVSPEHVDVRRWYQPKNGARLDVDAATARERVLEGVRAGSLERTISDVPVCVLLSGGVDSSAVAAHVVRQMPGLVAYVAVMDAKGPDVRAAREVAERLGVELREVRVDAPTADDLAGVVRAIEMPHKAQVEIAWACDALARAMRADGFKVTFSGEGSDELWASYGMSFHGIKKSGWYDYRRDLFLGQHRKNFARCNKVFMRHGVECRLPFLNTELVETALALAPEVVREKGRPKAALQDAHSHLLPERVVRRPKLAFQDGMGLQEACAGAVHDPTGFYRAVFKTDFRGAEP